MKMITTNTPEDTLADTLFKGIREYSEQHVESDLKEFGLSISDDHGNLVAGGVGKSDWGVMHVDFVWVSPRYRGNKYGQVIVDAFETEARLRGCAAVALDTMSFQAPDFYKRLGYQHWGSLPGYRHGITRDYLVKTLEAA